ncbi:MULTISPECIES: Rieske 2Fe-2S domain-containing protein [unclassified Cellulophaga]|uniref:Rieske 2Fe-2S domain-containing protein n=1 Tax=unclassified Cellulophaga TaxID=2634405 RepID=UPI001C4F41E4|nr:Rieske 2Fe-2S domain-containing protein [Cellulophaga sp. HaHa_2_1]QXP53784.1 Rieske 2Fe-2S domain-containing protein [Cellulophaga sp. HaHa_2_1]
MERKAFLKTLGAGAAFALTFSCLHGCSSDGESGETAPEEEGEVPTGVDITVDLNASTSSNLQNNGGFIFVKSKDKFTETDIIIVRNLQGELVAASKYCSHENNPNILFVNENDGIYECNVHGSRFAQDGTPLNSITSNPLKVFKTEVLANDILRIFEA